MRKHGHNSNQGSALVVILIVVVVALAIAASVILPNVARHRESQAAINRERAFMIAEAGIDWGIARVRESGGAVPDPAQETNSPSDMGTFTVTYTAGDANLLDDDGDGVVDNVEEDDYVTIDSIGVSGGETRGMRVLARRAVEMPTIEAAIQLNVEVPIIDLKGNSFLVDGDDHDLDGTPTASGTVKFGIASPAVASDLLGQLASKSYDQVTGLGDDPSLGQVDALDLARIIEQATSVTTIELSPGTHTGGAYGTATPEGVEVVYCAGDLHFSGGLTGAGVLVVDGDLRSSGQFEWRGIVIVRGRTRFTGGGTTKRIIGALIAGEELDSDLDTTSVTVTGTVDILYSDEAIELASGMLSIVSILSWNEIGT